MIIPIGASGIDLDVFLKFNNTLTDPLSITYQIFDASDTITASGSGFRRSIGHYDARNSIIPSGYDDSNSWHITWTFLSPANVVGTATEEFTVVDALSATFTDSDEITEQVKIDLGLLDADFTDSDYEKFIIKALNLINLKLCLKGDDAFTIQDDGSISPEINEAGQALIILAIECLIQKRKRAIAIGKGIRVKDGDSEIDTTAGFTGHKDLSDSICGDFDKSITHILFTGCSIKESSSESASGEIVWYNNSRIFEPLDHDGQGSGENAGFESPFDNGFSWSFGCR